METECHDLVDEISGISVDTDDGRPGPSGDVFESSDRHVFEHQQVMESLTAQCSASDRTASSTGAYNELYPVVCVLKHNYN